MGRRGLAPSALLARRAVRHRRAPAARRRLGRRSAASRGFAGGARRARRWRPTALVTTGRHFAALGPRVGAVVAAATAGVLAWAVFPALAPLVAAPIARAVRVGRRGRRARARSRESVLSWCDFTCRSTTALAVATLSSAAVAASPRIVPARRGDVVAADTRSSWRRHSLRGVARDARVRAPRSLR